jgi:hypothetical protein
MSPWHRTGTARDAPRQEVVVGDLRYVASSPPGQWGGVLSLETAGLSVRYAITARSGPPAVVGPGCSVLLAAVLPRQCSLRQMEVYSSRTAHSRTARTPEPSRCPCPEHVSAGPMTRPWLLLRHEQGGPMTEDPMPGGSIVLSPVTRPTSWCPSPVVHLGLVVGRKMGKR